MATDAIVFALANPEPEIMPDLIQGMARVIATGRSDYPNQINNVLCFPGLFRGAFDAARDEHHRGDEDRRGPRHRGDDPGQPAHRGLHPPLASFNPEVSRAFAAAVAAEAVRAGNVRPQGSRVFI